jgi:hypothetical protein
MLAIGRTAFDLNSTMLPQFLRSGEAMRDTMFNAEASTAAQPASMLTMSPTLFASYPTSSEPRLDHTEVTSEAVCQ